MLSKPPTIVSKTALGCDWQEQWERGTFTVTAATMEIRTYGGETQETVLGSITCAIDGTRTYAVVDFTAVDGEGEALFAAGAYYEYVIIATIEIESSEYQERFSDTFCLGAA